MDKNRPQAKAEYQITVKGLLPYRWSERFEDMEIIHQPDGTTILSGNVPDQAALYGLLIKLRDLGLTLLAIQKT